MNNFVIIRHFGDSIEIFTLPVAFFIFADNMKDGAIRVRFAADECGTSNCCMEFILKPKDFMGRFIEDHTELYATSILSFVRTVIANDLALFIQNGYTRGNMEGYDCEWVSNTFILDDFLEKWSESYSRILRHYHNMVSKTKQTDPK